MSKRKINITQKLAYTYIIIILAAIISGAFCLFTLLQYQKIDKEMVLVNSPCIKEIEKIKEYSKQINKSTKKWVFLSSENDKDIVNSLIKNEYATSIKKLNKISRDCSDKKEATIFTKIKNNNKIALSSISKLTSLLINFESFFDEEKVNSATSIYTSKIALNLKSNDKLFQQILLEKNRRQNVIFNEKKTLINYLTFIVFCAVISILLISVFSIYYTKNKISAPLIQLKKIIENVTKGDIQPILESNETDEIADMQNELRTLVNSLNEKTSFAKEIGSGNYFSEINILSEKDKLGNSLIEMSFALQKNNLQIKNSQSSLNNAQKTAKIGSWEYEIEKKELSWSDEMYSIFEMEHEDSLEKIIEIYKTKIHPEDKPILSEIINEKLISGDTFNYNHRIVKKDGSIKFVQGKGTIEKNSLNKIIRIKGIVQDITKQKEIENELLIALRNAENLTKAKDEFMSSMSHEIRTPLNGIIGFTNILINNTNLTEQQNKQLEAIKTSGDILLVIINDILDLAKIEAGKMTLEENPLNLKKLTQLILDTFAVKINEKKLVIQLLINENIPTNLLGDSVRISQILFNLVSNAIKFTPANGSILLKLDIKEKFEEYLKIDISVKDTGIGIHADKIESIFEPFVQTSDDTARKYGGTGLGLSIVKKLIDLMKGKIIVESEIGIGTTFTVTIPFKLNLKIDMRNALNYLKSLKETAIQQESKTLKILLAEDNFINQLLAQTVLAQFNYEVTTVENGALALEAVMKSEYDIVLMDLMMPEMDGYDSSIAIRALSDQKKSKIPIIAVSADVTNSVITKCSIIGINDYISKPFDSNELKAKILKLTVNYK